MFPAMPWLTTVPVDDPLAQIRDVPLARVIRNEVLASILRGELAPGDRITEPVIAARLGVSRVPVREALRDLESTGLVEARKHAGVFVRQVSPQETAELYELRAILDAHAGRTLAAAPDPVVIASLRGLLKNMEVAVAALDVTAYYEVNLHFHWQIIVAAGNEQTCHIYRGIVQKLHLVRLRNLSSDTGMLESLREHHAIVEAIAAGDMRGCETLMEAHVKSGGRRLAALQNAAPLLHTTESSHPH
jgi:DNA-binding GntR family transcriptional regulator